MSATINENSGIFDRLQLVELERQYTEAKQSLTAFQIEQVEKGNLSMIQQFPAMTNTYQLYCAIERKRAEVQERAAPNTRLIL